MARTVAHETEAHFFSISGPEIIHKFYGESEAHLRKMFDEAARKAPSIIFPGRNRRHRPATRERVVGDVEKRVVAQLLALMDGLHKGQTSSSSPPRISPMPWTRPCGGRAGSTGRSRSPSPTGTGGRRSWRSTAGECPWPKTSDMAHVADITHGFVGADLEALCREAAMIACAVSCRRSISPSRIPR